MYYVIVMLKNVDQPIMLSFADRSDAVNYCASAKHSPDVVGTIFIEKDKYISEVYNSTD